MAPTVCVTHSFLAHVPSDSLTSMLGRSLQSAPGATGMCLMRAATSGFISLQMWSYRMGCSCLPRSCGQGEIIAFPIHQQSLCPPTIRWKCDCGSPLYRISREEAPFLMSGRSDMESRTVMVRRGADALRVMLESNCGHESEQRVSV